ncbi:hypothetical protein RO21_01670 [[Actinobacillus] muris]|uniref:Uncharacterized protein n=1 Tax=Muribacter muris TaxID=67855 RepID=A0A0J5P7X9_9PAST|nr:hypothetical protein [Muribacter muris]KMK52321.1 hypothetical protein RO21_01670 [[Actinobacillus] muris] [Muribacter muris]
MKIGVLLTLMSFAISALAQTAKPEKLALTQHQLKQKSGDNPRQIYEPNVSDKVGGRPLYISDSQGNITPYQLATASDKHIYRHPDNKAIASAQSEQQRFKMTYHSDTQHLETMKCHKQGFNREHCEYTPKGSRFNQVRD